MTALTYALFETEYHVPLLPPDVAAASSAWTAFLEFPDKTCHPRP